MLFGTSAEQQCNIVVTDRANEGTKSDCATACRQGTFAMTHYIRIAALTACFFTVPKTVLAEARVIVVRSADLALNEPRDVVRLDRRIDRAAKEACGPISNFDLVSMNRRGTCTRASVAAARLQRDRVISGSALR